MKFTKFGTFLFSALLVSSCSDENPWTGVAGEGGISPRVVTDNTVTDVVPITRAEEQLEAPSVDDFKLTLTKSDGSYSINWESVNLFPVEESFSIGTYKMEASFGDAEKEGFECPYFYGSAEFEVEEGETTEVGITASLANTMVSIDYTDAFKTYFKTYSTQLHSKGGDYIAFIPGETRPAFLRPGEVSLTVSLVKQNGVSATFEPAAIQTAAKHHYHITLDVNNGETGDAQLSILFDDSLVEEDIVIDLSDELMLSPEPEVTAKGFTPGESFSVYECQPADEAKQFVLVAKGGLGSVILTTKSEQLLAKGLPEELDLMAATAAQQALLRQLGFEIGGLWKNPDKMAFVDLTNVFSIIEGAGTHEFTLVAKDKLTKVSLPITMTATTMGVDLNITGATASALGSNFTDLTVEYTGNSFNKNVTFEALNSNGTWVKCNVISVNNNGNTYTARVAIPSGSYDVKVRAKYCGKERSEVTVSRHGVTLAVNDYDVWATKATVSISTIPSSVNFDDVALYVAGGSGEYAIHTNIERDATNKTITLLGLTPGTSYSVKGSATGQYEEYYPALTFTTEAAQQVGNAGFEEFSTAIFNYKIAITGAAKTANWYLPWTDESTAWWDVNSRTTLRTEPTTAYQNYKVYPTITYINSGAHGGTNAAQIATVATGHMASEWASGTAYAGELFIGKSNTGHQDDWGYASTGHAFSSRPTSMSFYYQYDSYDGEQFYMKIDVLAADGSILTTSEQTGGAASEWTKFDVPLTYQQTNKKAAKIFITFKSSTSSDPGVTKKKLTHVGSDNENHYIGSVLRVDDIVLNY